VVDGTETKEWLDIKDRPASAVVEYQSGQFSTEFPDAEEDYNHAEKMRDYLKKIGVQPKPTETVEQALRGHIRSALSTAQTGAAPTLPTTNIPRVKI